MAEPPQGFNDSPDTHPRIQHRPTSPRPLFARLRIALSTNFIYPQDVRVPGTFALPTSKFPVLVRVAVWLE